MLASGHGQTTPNAPVRRTPSVTRFRCTASRSTTRLCCERSRAAAAERPSPDLSRSPSTAPVSEGPNHDRRPRMTHRRPDRRRPGQVRSEDHRGRERPPCARRARRSHHLSSRPMRSRRFTRIPLRQPRPTRPHRARPRSNPPRCSLHRATGLRERACVRPDHRAAVDVVLAADPTGPSMALRPQLTGAPRTTQHPHDAGAGRPRAGPYLRISNGCLKAQATALPSGQGIGEGRCACKTSSRSRRQRQRATPPDCPKRIITVSDANPPPRRQPRRRSTHAPLDDPIDRQPPASRLQSR